MRRGAARATIAEARLLLARFGRILAVIASLVAVAVVVAPVLVQGVDQSRGVAAAIPALGYAAALAVLVGPLLVVVGLGGDYDRGTRQVRFLAGVGGPRLATCQLLAVVACVAGMVVLAAVLGAAGGVADLLVGEVTGRDPELVGVPGGAVRTAALGVGAALGAVVLTWLLVLACRSGRRAALCWMALLLSLVLPLLRAEGTARELVAGHPLATVWAAVDPFAASSLSIALTPYSWVSTGVALACLVGFARIGLRRV